MSIASYKANERRRVTGPFMPTCFPASLEQVSPDHRLPPRTYQNWLDFLDWYESLSKKEKERAVPEQGEAMEDMFRSLGGFCCEDVVFKRANTPLGCIRIINRLIEEEYRVVIDIDYRRREDYYHSVGLVPIERGYVTLVSNQIPRGLEGVIPLGKVARRLAMDPEPCVAAYPYNNANITALPAV